jgi:rhodanese-related sulfurtransferase
MSFFVRLIPALATAVFASVPALAQSAAPPSSIPGAQVVSVEEARNLVGTVAFFDVRPPISFGRGHIKSAASLPYDEKSAKSAAFDASQDRFDVTRLPKDKALPIVFYGDGGTAWKGYKAATLATRAGYSNVKWLRAGTLGWIEKGAPLE